MKRGSEKERLSRSVQFTKGEDGYFFYYHAWSNGIPVSNDEYETYLAGRGLEFFKAIAERKATEPRRPYWNSFRAICKLMPSGSVFILGGLVPAKWAVNSVSTLNATLSGALALFFFCVGIMILIAQLQSNREMSGR
jgi:hypothetical protein